MLLYHSGFQEIREPDVHRGRKNADFGQGFYMTAEVDFARRWARRQKGEQTIVNRYRLDTEGLKVVQLERNADWFDYVFANRTGKPDALEADVIIGPIANDTIYNTFGIITSGFLSREEALRLLMIGPAWRQIVLKTEKAAGQLTWLAAEVLSEEETAGYQAVLAEEEKEYQRLFAEEMEKIQQEEEKE